MSKSIFFVLTIMVCCGCISTEYNPVTHKQDVYFYSSEREVNIGTSVAQAVSREFKFETDTRVIRRVNEIGEKIAAQCDRQEMNYRFYVIHDEKKNAFSLPGGFVYIHKGLLDILESDDEVAFVLGHEVAHVVARHAIKRLQAVLGYNILMIASTQAPSTGGLPQGITLALATVLSGYAQEDELLADKLGIEYAKKAGFQPEASLGVFTKLEEVHKKEPARPMEYFRTHPFIYQRIKSAKEMLGLPLDFRDIINS